MKGKGLKAGSFLLTFVCVFVFSAVVPFKSEAATLSSLESQYDKLENQLKDIKDKISNAQDSKEQELLTQKNLDQQIAITSEQITNLNDQIELLKSEIAQKEQEIIDKQQDIDDNFDLFLKRMRAMYIAGDSSTLEVLLGAESFGDFLTRADVVTRVAEHDRELIAQLKTDKEDIESAKASIESDKAKVEANQAAYSTKQADLQSQMGESQEAYEMLLKMEQEYKAKKEQIDKDMEQVQAEIDEIYRQNLSVGSYYGGEMTWPVIGSYYISSYYGWRPTFGDFHTGVDITGNSAFGKSVVAANGGKVIYTQNTYVAGKGYGKYIIIDHGGNISTLYAHLNEIDVSVGQTVSKGQVIGKVGTTGWSTGPHLHFEVRISGAHTDPLPYITSSSK